MSNKEIVLNQDQPANSTFQPKGLGDTIFKQRYAQGESESWEAACRRVATHVAKVKTVLDPNGKVAFTKN